MIKSLYLVTLQSNVLKIGVEVSPARLSVRGFFSLIIAKPAEIGKNCEPKQRLFYGSTSLTDSSARFLKRIVPNISRSALHRCSHPTSVSQSVLLRRNKNIHYFIISDNRLLTFTQKKKITML